MRSGLTSAVIVLQIFAWASLLAFPYFNTPPGIEHYLLNFHVKHLNKYLWLVLVFNLNFFVLIPRFFQQHKFNTYTLLSIALLAGLLLSDTLISETMFDDVYHLGFRVRLITVVPFVASFASSAALKALADWLVMRENTRILEAEKRKAEMAFLRSQLHPHFLFNTLNNIVELMHKDVGRAEDFVIRLSAILRAVLQKEETSTIALNEEIELVRNYVDLQLLRLSSNNKVRFDVKGNTDRLVIEPLLLINFVENVFKHGLSDEENELVIIVQVDARTLELRTENNLSSKNDTLQGKGIGLENAKKRLDIVYHNRYSLQTSVLNNRYIVILKLELECA